MTNPSAGLKCEEAIRCVFDLNNLDIAVYKTLQRIGPSRADVIAQHLNKERSTVYRSLQKLTNCGLCIKQTQTIETGGYYHVYMVNQTKLIKNHLESCLDEWYHHMKHLLIHFEHEIN